MSQIIKIKRNGTPDPEAEPTTLAEGELAANISTNPAQLWIGGPGGASVIPITEPTEDAPSDAVYGRTDGQWVRAVAIAGDTMTGPLTFDKPDAWSVNTIFGAQAGVNLWEVQLGGMHDGDLIIKNHGAIPTNAVVISRFNGQVTLGAGLGITGPTYANGISNNGTIATGHLDASGSVKGQQLEGQWINVVSSNPSLSLRLTGPDGSAQVNFKQANDQRIWSISWVTSDDNNIALSRYDNDGARIDNPLTVEYATGDVLVTHDPTQDLGVATKQYVDGVAGNYLPLTGGTLTGDLTMTAGFYYRYGAGRLAYGRGVSAIGSWFFGNAGNLTTNANSNIGIGNNALVALTTGTFNVGVGQMALSSADAAGSNIAVGGTALANVRGAGSTFNVAVGHNAGLNLQGGTRNLFIGADTGPSVAATGSNSTVIGSSQYGIQNDFDSILAIGTGTTLRIDYNLTRANWLTLHSNVSVNGTVEVTRDPADNFEVATKQYVDAKTAPGSSIVTVSDVAPSNPAQGAFWWDSASGQLFICWGTQWVVASKGATGQSKPTTRQARAALILPTNPAVGDIFMFWQWDGDKWMLRPSPDIANEPPDDPFDGQLWWDSNDDADGGQFYIYYGEDQVQRWIATNQPRFVGEDDGTRRRAIGVVASLEDKVAALEARIAQLETELARQR